MARPRTKEQTAYEMAFRPIVLKGLCVDCGISQAWLGNLTQLSRPSINLALNRGYIPKEVPDFQKIIEFELAKNPKAVQWLSEREMQMKEIWKPLGKDLRKTPPAGRSVRSWETRKKPVFKTGAEITIIKEVEMISQEAMKHFKIFRNPFIDDIQKDSDVFMSEEHRYIEAAMLDAARHSGF